MSLIGPIIKNDVLTTWAKISKIAGYLKPPKYIAQGLLLYLAMTAADFASSLSNRHEINPFARHLDGSFWPLHALANCLINTVGVAILSASLYCVGRAVNKGWAQFVAALPFLYFGFIHLDAALWNLQIKMGLYSPTIQEILHKILGDF